MSNKNTTSNIGTHVREFSPGVTIKPFKNVEVKDTKDVLVKRGDNVTHGDVIIIKADETDLPSNFNELEDAPRGFMALGEHTGHAHAIMEDSLESDTYAADVLSKLNSIVDGTKNQGVRTFALKVTKAGEMFLKIEGGSYLLKHQEHVPFRLHTGVYEIGIQQEVDMFSKKVRQVMD